MKFVKHNNIYQVSRITGSKDNILGLVFSSEKSSSPEVFFMKKVHADKIKTNKDEIVKQVLEGVREFNAKNKVNFHVKEIHYIPSEISSRNIYTFLASEILKRLSKNEDFTNI